jgi:phosphatidylglycerophosphate synthase
MLVILFSRDIIVAYLRIMAVQSGVTLSARQSGKIKAISQGFAQIGSVVLLIGLKLGLFGSLSPYVGQAIWLFFAITTAVTLYSLIDYARAVFSIHNAPSQEDGPKS